MTTDIERDIYMSEFSWYDPNLYVNNGVKSDYTGDPGWLHVVWCMGYGIGEGWGEWGEGEGEWGRRRGEGGDDNRDGERYVYV